jgi:hypothetical protein
MKDNSVKGKTRPRKPYSKPEARQIPLRPEEAVLGGCKSATQAGVAHATCNDFISPCPVIAS